MMFDTTRAGGFGDPLPERDILEGFDRLIAEGKIYGAERNPDVLKKSGSGESFLAVAVPSLRRLLSVWDRLFGNRVSPVELLRHLAVEIHGFEHREAILLFARGRLLYDCQIFQGKEAVGHLTLDLYRERDRVVPFLPFPTRPGRRVVYIEGISLTRQSTGYASALFRRYERVFHDLGFHLFRLKASLSVGKYYWAKEGFDCSDREQFREIRDRLWDLVWRLDLPVAEQEVRRLTHMSDVAAFRRDLPIPSIGTRTAITPSRGTPRTPKSSGSPSGRRSSSAPIRGTGTRSSTPTRRGARASSGRRGSSTTSRGRDTRRARNGWRRSSPRSARRGCGKA